jgi:hypothetical protein
MDMSVIVYDYKGRGEIAYSFIRIAEHHLNEEWV